MMSRAALPRSWDSDSALTLTAASWIGMGRRVAVTMTASSDSLFEPVSAATAPQASDAQVVNDVARERP
jgi:hypothetical protein